MLIGLSMQETLSERMKSDFNSDSTEMCASKAAVRGTWMACVTVPLRIARHDFVMSVICHLTSLHLKTTTAALRRKSLCSTLQAAS